MNVREAMRTTGAARYFKPDDVPDEVIFEAIEAARFGPSGGNRQPVRWIVVRDPALKTALAAMYRPLNERDLAKVTSGKMELGGRVERAVRRARDYAENWGDSPVIIVACAILSGMHEHMMDPGGPNMIAGSSVYPMVQNLCLAFRELGVATTLTTLLCEKEAEVAELLEIPDGVVCACHITAGYPPEPFPKKLSRLPVDELVYADRFGSTAASSPS